MRALSIIVLALWGISFLSVIEKKGEPANTSLSVATIFSTIALALWVAVAG